MKRILMISQKGGLITFSWCASMFLFSIHLVQPFKFIVRLAAHLVNLINDLQMILHTGLMKVDREIKIIGMNIKHYDNR